MQIKNYRLTADEIIDLVQTDPQKSREVIRDLIHEYNSMPCGITWKVADPVKEEVFFDNNGVKRSMSKSFAYLKHRADLSISCDSQQPPNDFIIGDNYHALQLLQDKFYGQFGLIYCDVPYNTGKANEFKYNDKYIDSSDPWRDAKWLSFINKRFRLIKNLLQPHGILGVSIDDYEIAQLILLLDEIFGRANRLAICPVEVNSSGKNRKGIAVQHEYLLLYTRDINECIDKVHVALNATTKGFAKTGDPVLKFIATEEGAVLSTMDALAEFVGCKGKSKRDIKAKCEKIGYGTTYDMLSSASMFDCNGPFKKRGIIKTGSDSDAVARPTMAYNIYYDDTNMVDDIDFKPIFYLEKDLPNIPANVRDRLICIQPVDANGNKKRWSWKDENVIAESQKGGNLLVTKTEKKSGAVSYAISYREYVKYAGGSSRDITPSNVKGFRVEQSFTTRLFTTLLDDIQYRTTNGTNRLKELIGNSGFGYPKPVPFIEDILKTFTKQGDIVGDFFVGSGTTMEAVLSVNKATGRNLRFITCTNNENNIAYDVTLKRLQALVNKGYDINLNVFEIGYHEVDDLSNVAENINLVSKLCEYTHDYYKLVYNVTREQPLNVPDLRCLINDYDGIVLIIKKDTGLDNRSSGKASTSPTGLSGFGDFMKKSNNSDAVIKRIFNNLPNDVLKIYICESDIKDRYSDMSGDEVNLDELYPINLIETIKYAIADTKDKSVLMETSSNSKLSEEEENLLRRASVEADISSDEDTYNMDFTGDEEDE